MLYFFQAYLFFLLLLLLIFPLIGKVPRGSLAEIRTWRIFIRFIPAISDLEIFLSIGLTELCFFSVLVSYKIVLQILMILD